MTDDDRACSDCDSPYHDRCPTRRQTVPDPDDYGDPASDAREALRDAERAADAAGDPHGPACRCHACCLDEYEP